jgi:hypothetical protein
MEVLEQVDRMLPGLLDEDDLQYMLGRYKFRRGLKKAGRAYDASTTIGTGVALVTIGVLMLIPGPVDALFAVAGGAAAGYFFGPGAVVTGAIIGVAIYNIAAVAVIVVGVVVIVSGLIEMATDSIS